MSSKRILIVGGGTAGWLTAAYLARFLDLASKAEIEITLLESRDLGIIGVGEGAFPTIRSTLQFIGVDETEFIRGTSATFKQGIRFDDWAGPNMTGRYSALVRRSTSRAWSPGRERRDCRSRPAP